METNEGECTGKASRAISAAAGRPPTGMFVESSLVWGEYAVAEKCASCGIVMAHHVTSDVCVCV